MDVRTPARPLDLGGLISLAAAVLLLVVPLVLGNAEGWPAWAFASLALSAVRSSSSPSIERYVERSGGAPLIAGRVLRAPGMPAALVAIVLALASYGGFLFTFTQHLQLGLRDSPLQAGLTFVPMALGLRPVEPQLATAADRLAPAGHPGWLHHRRGRLFAHRQSPRPAVPDGGLVLPVALFVAGFGQGMAASPILTAALSKVAPQDAADASGVVTTVIQLGLVIGVATFGSVFLNEAALPGIQPTVGAITVTLVLIVIALLSCAVAATAMVRAQRSPSVAFGDAAQDAGGATSAIGTADGADEGAAAAGG